MIRRSVIQPEYFIQRGIEAGHWFGSGDIVKIEQISRAIKAYVKSSLYNRQELFASDAEPRAIRRALLKLGAVPLKGTKLWAVRSPEKYLGRSPREILAIWKQSVSR